MHHNSCNRLTGHYHRVRIRRSIDLQHQVLRAKAWSGSTHASCASVARAASSGDRAVDLALKRWTQDSPNYQRLQRSDCQSRKVGGVTPRMRITTYRALHVYVTITRPARVACALRSDAGCGCGVLSGCAACWWGRYAWLLCVATDALARGGSVRDSLRRDLVAWFRAARRATLHVHVT